MKIENLQKKVNALINASNKTIQNRNYWNQTTKQLLVNTLTNIVEEYPIEWSVQTINVRKNFEGVTICFNSMPSGIFEDNQNQIISFTKEGGSVLFTQTYNGEIIVLISYPYIEKLVLPTKCKVLGKYKPEVITEGLIVKNVSLFLDEMTNWETSIYGNPVGYNLIHESNIQNE